MKYKYKHSLSTILLFSAICLVDLATIVKVVLDWISGKQFNVAVNIITLVMCVLVTVPVIATLTIRYKITPQYLNMYFAFINITKNKIHTANIVYVTYRVKERKLFIGYVTEDYASELAVMQIVIHPKNFAAFVNDLKSANPNTAFIEEE